MKRLILTLLIGSSLVGCYRNADRVDEVADNNYPNTVTENRNTIVDDNDDNIVDTHHDYVTGLGFTNVLNPNGTTYNTRYTLNNDYANRDEVFNQWRYTWVEPADYVDKDIDVYRYTGTLNGENRHIYVLTSGGKVIGGFHHGENETIEDATILEEGTYTSRLANDFRTTWDDLFGIRR